MSGRSTRWLIEIALLLTALGLGGLAFGPVGEATADVLYFGSWCAAMLLIFSLGLRLPLHPRGPLARLLAPGLIATAFGLVLFGNVALYRHDAHFDATVTGRYTPPPELEKVARQLRGDVVLTYFYNSKDENADAAKQVLAVAARRYPHLRVRSLDLDTEFTAARDYGVKLYNTVVVEAQGRRTQVENTVDLRQMAYAIERALQQRMQTVCFMTGHGEHYTPGHVHYAHREILGGEQQSGSGLLEAPAEGLDRLKLAIETVGYSDRAINATTLPAIPQDCAIVADFGAVNAYTPADVSALKGYLLRGGHLLLAYDPRFSVSPELASLLDEVGLRAGHGVVVDPTNHYGTDQEQVAVPYYPPHPITEQIALTVFPEARPIRLQRAVGGIKVAELIATSKDSYVRPVLAAAGSDPTLPSLASGGGVGRGPLTPQLIAAAVQGTWPGGGQAPFRLILVGNASFASNAFFPYASNGDLAVSMVRWLAADTTPQLKPETYSLPEIRLTHRQMQVTFLTVEVLLPLSVALIGVAVWWRRR
ncbi:MAG: Gldg family protein [Alphaproteobacteria bacterium]|nr:Gldg family protein [Alphaproteobacteria bacterium]